MRLVLFLFFICSSLSASFAQFNNTKTQRSIIINDILNFYQFEELREYIYNNGSKQEYCTNSGEVPHLKVKGTDIDLYLIHYSKKTELNIEDYSVIYLVSDFNGTPFNYYLYMTDAGAVYLYDYRKLLRNESIKKEALSELRDNISKVKKAVKFTD